ncbi:helix-turn-helix domain-containing protein [Paenibacillus solisilvae]|uniref:Helix-turn-helix domain-containing protein n=1 Tax=Paenibacillus solisilvae TaxID=2486751 RepID=A0ABW0W8Z4_9BACL
MNDELILSSLGQRLRKIRIDNGYSTQKELSNISGISQATLSRIEAGLQLPVPETLKTLSKFFKNITYSDLLMHAGYMEESKPSDYKSSSTSSTEQLFSPREERDIAADLERMINDLESNNALAFQGEPMNEETKELMRISLENSLRLAKGIAKKKFTPNNLKN